MAIYRCRRQALLSGAALVMTIMSGSALAQVPADPSPAASPPAAAPDVNSGDIVVTAQRREQNLLSVPLSISAQKGETLRATGVKDITGLRFNTPGFIASSGSGYTQIYIRGIGNRVQTGADPSVATFIDDTPRVYASLVNDLTYVERVEVLKGAQGGLYGRNATGGVLNIITRQPGDKFAAEARVGYGTKQTFDASVYVNVPLNDNVAMNFTASRESHDDYLTNIAVSHPYASYAALSPAAATALGDTGQRAYLIANPDKVAALDAGAKVSRSNNQDMWYVNGKIRFKGDGFKVTLSGDWSDKDDAYGNGWQYAQPTRAFATYNALMNGAGNAQARLPIDYVFPAIGKFQNLGSIEQYSKQTDYGASVKADIDMPGFTLTSITSFRWNRSRFRGDVGAGGVPIAGFVTDFQRRNIYQEIRMVSSSDGPFSWLAGATYFHERIANSLASILLGNTLSPTTANTGANAFSGYGQGEYKITPQLKIIASLRYLTETKTAVYPAQSVAIFNANTNTVTNGVPVPEASGKVGFHKFVPAATLSYELANGGNVYARWARGFKSGGINPLVHPAQTLGVINTFKPESVDTYEIGLRANLLDHKLQFTSAIFYNNYRNLQITKPGYSGLPFVIFNAGKARTYGAEASVNWQAMRYFSVAANIGYLNAKYVDFTSPGIPLLKVAAFDFSGNKMILAPKWQGSITANLDMPVTDQFNAVGTLFYSYSTSFFTDDGNEPLTAQRKAYSLVNLRLGARTSDGRIGAYVSVNNLFDKHYLVFGNVAAGSIYNIPGNRRIITGQVELKF